jgi:hypothetical protein
VAARKPLLLRVDPAVHDALVRWASDELRSTTAQIELLLRRALADAGRLPPNVGSLPRRGRPPKQDAAPEDDPPRPREGPTSDVRRPEGAATRVTGASA